MACYLVNLNTWLSWEHSPTVVTFYCLLIIVLFTTSIFWQCVWNKRYFQSNLWLYYQLDGFCMLLLFIPNYLVVWSLLWLQMIHFTRQCRTQGTVLSNTNTQICWRSYCTSCTALELWSGHEVYISLLTKSLHFL